MASATTNLTAGEKHTFHCAAPTTSLADGTTARMALGLVARDDGTVLDEWAIAVLKRERESSRQALKARLTGIVTVGKAPQTARAHTPVALGLAAALG